MIDLSAGAFHHQFKRLALWHFTTPNAEVLIPSESDMAGINLVDGAGEIGEVLGNGG